MFPTTPRCRSRSTNISVTRSSSRMATWVSWPFDVTIISFCIRETPKRVRGTVAAADTRVRIEIRDGAHHANERNQTIKNVAHEPQSELISKPTHPDVLNK